VYYKQAHDYSFTDEEERACLKAKILDYCCCIGTLKKVVTTVTIVATTNGANGFTVDAKIMPFATNTFLDTRLDWLKIFSKN
jgi:hypothetical protein